MRQNEQVKLVDMKQIILNQKFRSRLFLLSSCIKWIDMKVLISAEAIVPENLGSVFFVCYLVYLWVSIEVFSETRVLRIDFFHFYLQCTDQKLLCREVDRNGFLFCKSSHYPMFKTKTCISSFTAHCLPTFCKTAGKKNEMMGKHSG